LLIYDLTLIGVVITVGRLGDLFGRRRFYASGFLFFVLASALCGVAQSAGQIILFRGLQAMGGAMIAANGRAIASVALPSSERGNVRFPRSYFTHFDQQSLHLRHESAPARGLAGSAGH